MLIDILRLLCAVVLGYFVLLNTSGLALVLFGAVEIARHVRLARFAGLEEMYGSPLTRPVSVLLPVGEGSPGLLDTVHATLSLWYPEFEVVVIEDGSAEGVFDRLRTEFDLVEVPRVVPEDVPTVGAVTSVHVPKTSRLPLVVVRKENGERADALNLGLNLARYPLVCVVDGDSVLDAKALLWAAKPFADDPLRVVATAAAIRLLDGSEVVSGRVVATAMPRRWLARISVVECTRVSVLARAGLSRLRALAVLSNTFAVFRRDLAVKVEGFASGPACASTDLLLRLHERQRGERAECRVVFVGEPIVWRSGPESLPELVRRRVRRDRGTRESLARHRGMTGNPRYGALGLVGLPYHAVLGFLAPPAESLGVALIVAGLALGALTPEFLWWFLLLAYAYGTVVTVLALLAEEFAFQRFRRVRDLWAAGFAAVLENLGYRQLIALCGWGRAPARDHRRGAAGEDRRPLLGARATAGRFRGKSG